MTSILAVAVFALYVWAYRRYGHRFPEKPATRSRPCYFATGSLVLAIAFGPQIDGLADASFAWHMVQHMAIAFIAPPLLLLGAPLLYVLGALPARHARAISRALHSEPLRTLFAPVPAWLLFVATLWVSHFSPLYNAALNNGGVHVGEHALYFGTGLLFWSVVVQTGIVVHQVAFPARMLYVFLAIPQGAFLGLALYQTRSVLYAHYAAGHSVAQVLVDQHNAGALMWIGGGMLFFTAFMLTAATWAARDSDERLGLVTE